SDVRVRPGKGSRPRSKRRPAHADAVSAMVVAVDRGRWRCALDDDPERIVTAMRARELGRPPIVVGDRVKLVGDVSGRPDTLARIVRVLERESVLRRTADDTDPYERVVVANAEQLLIVTSLADPPPRTGFIDRCLVACYTGGLDPVLCLTKADLASPDELLAYYADLDVPAVVNRLVPDADLATGEVSAIGKGRHTSVAAVALPLPEGGWVIDTPGVRSFGLAHVTPDELVAAFPQFAEAAEECPPNYGHLGAPE